MKRFTLSVFMLLAASQLLAQGKAEKLVIQNKGELAIQAEVYYGTRSIPGYNIIGTYIYPSSSDKHPIVQLNQDGTGIFERHNNIPVKIKWWIYSDEKGVAKVNKGEVGQQHTLIVQYLEPEYTTIRDVKKEITAQGDFDMKMLTIRYDDKKIYILGEREKSF